MFRLHATTCEQSRIQASSLLRALALEKWSEFPLSWGTYSWPRKDSIKLGHWRDSMSNSQRTLQVVLLQRPRGHLCNLWTVWRRTQTAWNKASRSSNRRGIEREKSAGKHSPRQLKTSVWKLVPLHQCAPQTWLTGDHEPRKSRSWFRIHKEVGRDEASRDERVDQRSIWKSEIFLQTETRVVYFAQTQTSKIMGVLRKNRRRSCLSGKTDKTGHHGNS